MSAVAVVPARGGSTRIRRKNVRPFHGVPLIIRTLRTLADSGLFDRIVVSTDDDEIADVAQRAGADVPFRRPPALSDDHTPTAPVIAHALEQLRAEGPSEARTVCVAYPTAVFITPADLRAARTLLDSQPAPDFVAAACAFPAPIERALRITDDGTCRMVASEHRATRTQDLPPAYRDAGQFYWGTELGWLEQRPVFTSPTKLYVLPTWRVEDIDTPEDWSRAELLFELLQRRA